MAMCWMLQSFKYNGYNSKYAQHVLEIGHVFGKMDDIMSIKYYDKKGKQTQWRDFTYIKKLKIITSSLTNIPLYTTRSLEPLYERKRTLTNVVSPIKACTRHSTSLFDHTSRRQPQHSVQLRTRMLNKEVQHYLPEDPHS
jgi:hypothetical protein